MQDWISYLRKSASSAVKISELRISLRPASCWRKTDSQEAISFVGVIDSGFDFFHPALQANLKPGWFAPGVYHTDFLSMDGHGT